MNTYAESKNMKTINWNGVLNALSKDNLNSKQIKYFAEKSADWVTCACGNQCDVIPRTDDGEPYDDELDDLGVEFCMLWQRVGLFTYAKQTDKIKRTVKELMITLDLIEQRSIFLLKEMS